MIQVVNHFLSFDFQMLQLLPSCRSKSYHMGHRKAGSLLRHLNPSPARSTAPSIATCLVPAGGILLHWISIMVQVDRGIRSIASATRGSIICTTYFASLRSFEFAVVQVNETHACTYCGYSTGILYIYSSRTWHLNNPSKHGYQRALLNNFCSHWRLGTLHQEKQTVDWCG